MGGGVLVSEFMWGIIDTQICMAGGGTMWIDRQ